MRVAVAVTFVLAIASTMTFGQLRPTPVGEGQTPPGAPATMSNPAGVDAHYVIGSGDVLQISVWQEPQFGETVEVRPDGKISLPLVSDVAVAGLTPDAAQGRLTDKLEGFVKHPRVSVVVVQVRSKFVYVIGEVVRPGSYPMLGDINVEQLIARAGGTTQRAKEKQVYVLRSGQSQKVKVNYKKVLQGKNVDENVALMPGDTVVVP